MNEIKDEWRRYKYQIIGIALLLLSLLMGLIKETGIAYGILLGVLILDLYIIKKNHQTITQWFRRQFPGWFDKIIMSMLLSIIIYSAGWLAGFWFLFGTINGHLSW
ncbi:unnamed protein product, partial [marine sediment metagenome]